jgi:hypothetical protein
MERSMSIDQDLWSAMLPNGDIRSGTLEQLDEACRSGHLDLGTLVRPIHSDRWITLAQVLGGVGAAPAPPVATGIAAPRASVPAPRASVPVPRVSVPAPRASVPAPRASVPAPAVAPPPAPAPIDHDAGLWQVRLPNGEVRSGTRQQLVEAFVAGHLHEQMYVLAAGASQWVPLGTVMGRGETSASPTALPASAPPAADPPQALAAPEPLRAAPEPAAPSSVPEPSVPEPFAAQAPSAVQAPPAEDAASAAQASSAGPASSAARAPSAEHDVSAEQTPAAVQASFAEQASPAAPAADEQPDLPPAPDGDALWQVKLTRRQLEEASRAGLLGDDAWVLAAGSDQWVRFGDVRALASPETPLVAPSSSDATVGHGETAASNSPEASLQESV